VICEAFEGGSLSAAATIHRAQVACGISAKVILVTLQKEQGLVTHRAPSEDRLARAMGQNCPDTAPCATFALGFGNQVYRGTRQLKTYKAARFARQPGNHAIQFHPNAECGSANVVLQNFATTALYNYTPYQPNAAALINLSATGDSCSSYGNRNFFTFYTAWFGSPIIREQDELFVNALYLDFLGRPATSEDVAYWSSRLMNRQVDRYGVATSLSRSDEWISNVITGFYRNTLNREPDAAGLRGWINAARSGMPVSQIAAGFYASPEYFATVGQSNYQVWVTDLYQKLLLRAPDGAGLNGWVNALNAGMPRDTVSLGFYQSAETLGVRVNTLYRTFLGREGEPAGITNWMPFVARQGDLVLAAALAGSEEYFNRSQSR
jgi:hypothetical protein